MTVTYFTGKNTKSVSPSTHKQKGKKKESKLGRQGPAVFRHRHVRQPHSMLLVLKDIHSRKTPSRLGPLTNRLPFPSPPPTQILMLFSFSGSSLVGSHSPQKLSSIVCRGGLHGHRSSCLLLWVSAQILSSTLGDSY